MSGVCKHFGVCGGCDLQDKGYEEQLKMKQAHVEEIFAGLSPKSIADIVPSPEIWRYRNKMEYAAGRAADIPVIGLRQKRRFHRIVDIEECRIFDKDVEKLLALVKEWMAQSSIEPYNLYRHEGMLRYIALRHSKVYDEMMVVVVVAWGEDDLISVKEKLEYLVAKLKKIDKIKSIYCCINNGLADVALSKKIFLLDGQDHIKERINGIDYIIDASTFFQTNSFCCARLYDVIKEESGGLSGKAADIYCGSGGITLQIAKKFDTVIGVDSSARNIECAMKNAALNNIDNVDFVREDAEHFMSGLREKHGPGEISTIIVDPPRAGLGKKLISMLLAAPAPKIIYVSCGPRSLRDDLQILKSSYRIEKVIPVDMFPHTNHIETVTVLKKME
ncbi:MAG: 23S rRNA (uracil(1939)-C(5))-methyltransferase RlmD [Candidatus Omnitrophica bacterium]|nr:23S rRNA (uracil(1939)-C(5))-methyltransferase RlmD [Candidatus Omnitrophota bacterium]